MAIEWKLDPALIHLNHAAVGPWPLRTMEAVTAFAAENARIGSKLYLQWLAVEQRLRNNIAELINAPHADNIALVKNTSEGLSFIAYGIEWLTGDEIIISDEEFPSNRIVWESLQNQGVVVRQVSLTNGETPEQALVSAMNENTRLLAISSVQYASGTRLDINQLGKVCKQNNILFCVDAIQHIGALAFDAQACQADFVVADGHKWMLGPEGLALFYVHPETMPQLSLKQYGWHMVEDMGNFARQDWQPAHTARRFECGSPNMMAIHALDASISLLLETGMQSIETRVLANTSALVEMIEAEALLTLLSSAEPRYQSGIVTFHAPGMSSASLYQSLMENNIMCANRGGGIRFSPHYHTDNSQLTLAINKVLELVKSSA